MATALIRLEPRRHHTDFQSLCSHVIWLAGLIGLSVRDGSFTFG